MPLVPFPCLYEALELHARPVLRRRQERARGAVVPVQRRQGLQPVARRGHARVRQEVLQALALERNARREDQIRRLLFGGMYEGIT